MTQVKSLLKKSESKDKLPRTCFVISPIGSDGTDIHRKFKEVLDYIVRPAVEESGYDLRVIRADDIEQTGSIIKDILQSLLDAYVVIADLTNQNPNVFYELGVRHALKPRTILINEKSEDIPFDLKDYRTIIYENSTKGVASFRKKLKEFLGAMKKDPERSDNPVLDRLGSIIEANMRELQTENSELKKRLDDSLKGKTSTKTREHPPRQRDAGQRVDRILALINAKLQFLSGSFIREVNGEKESFEQPSEQGSFRLYYIMPNGKNIDHALYLSKRSTDINAEEEFADIRVLLERNSKGQKMETKFVIATDRDLAATKKTLSEKFKKMLNFVPSEQRKLFSLEIWDRQGLLRQERKLGLKV